MKAALFLMMLPFGAAAAVAPPVIDATAVLVMDRSTKRVLHGVNPDKPWPAASLTKLATAVVALNHAKLTSMSRVCPADDVGGAKLRVRSCATLSVQDLLAATLVGSANNTANSLVRASGHTRSQFVRDMNGYARRVGAKSTRFTEPTGIDPANVSTARDLALIARNAFAHGTIRSLTIRGSYTVRMLNTGERRRIKNTNKLVTHSPLIVMGGKTGLLNESRYNFVVEVRNRAWKRLIIAILGAPNFQSAFQSAEKLANWAWSQ